MQEDEANPDSRTWIVYLLRCRGDRLYCGITTDLDARWAAHASGKGARFTRAFPPEAVAACARAESHSSALRLEARIKRLPRERKLDALRVSAQSGASSSPHE